MLTVEIFVNVGLAIAIKRAMRDSSPGFHIRVKLVNLSQNSRFRRASASGKADASQVSALVGSTSERLTRPQTMSSIGKGSADRVPPEICIKTGGSIPQGSFEDHIENCAICANKVELQLDFIETLEVAIYQRKAQSAAPKVRGALLVSNPEMNFAICGELEL